MTPIRLMSEDDLSHGRYAPYRDWDVTSPSETHQFSPIGVYPALERSPEADAYRSYDTESIGRMGRLVSGGRFAGDDQALHDVAVYLCDAIVARNAQAYWVFDHMLHGLAWVEDGTKRWRLDPLPNVRQAQDLGRERNICLEFVHHVESELLRPSGRG